MTDRHFKKYSLDDRQELLDTSHHKITFDYDEDTTSLVENPTLTTAKNPSFQNLRFLCWEGPHAL